MTEPLIEMTWRVELMVLLSTSLTVGVLVLVLYRSL